MEKSHYSPIVFDLTDIIAFLVKKALIIVIVCFLCGAIGVGFNYLSSRSETAMEKFSQELDEYNKTLTNAKNSLDSLQRMRVSTIEAKENDPVLDLNEAKDVFVCKISFFISSEEDVIITEYGSIIYPNQEQMRIYYDSLNLSQVLDSDAKSSYLSRLVLYSAQGNNTIITVYGQSKDVAMSWAEKVYQELRAYAEDVQGWKIINRNDVIDSYDGLYIVNMVEEYNNTITELDNKIKDMTKEVKTLLTSRPSNLHPLRFFAIGFILGGGLIVLVLLLSHISRNPVTKSFIAEKIIQKPFIGALFSDKGLFDRLARRVIGERRFQSESDEIDFIRHNIKNSFLSEQKIGSVCILCSSSEKNVGTKAKTLESILSESGYKTELVVDASTNPNSTDAVIRSDAVLLLESQWKSKWSAVSLSMELAERFDKQIIGFVLC